MTPDDALLTTGDAAKRLGVAPNTLRRWAADHRVRFIRMPSGQLRFRTSDLDAVLTVHEPQDAA